MIWIPGRGYRKRQNSEREQLRYTSGFMYRKKLHNSVSQEKSNFRQHYTAYSY